MNMDRKPLHALLALGLTLAALAAAPTASAVCALHSEPPVMYGRTCVYAQVGGGSTGARIDGWYVILGQDVSIDQSLP